jgi:cytochrome c5
VGLVLIVVLVGVIYALTVGTMPAMDPMVGSSVDERLKPVGQVRVADGSEAAAPAAAPDATPAAASGEAASGEAIYAKACFVCHASGAAGAPKLGDKKTWGPRVALGMDALLATAIKGKGAMPPRGTCGTCSDADLRAAIEYMLSKVQ